MEVLACPFPQPLQKDTQVRRKKSGRRFVMIHKRVLKSPEWKSLSPAEKSIYIDIKAEYNGGNNGDIPFHYSEHKGEYHPATIAKILGGPKTGEGSLIKKGWLKKKMIGGRYRYQCFYELTGEEGILR